VGINPGLRSAQIGHHFAGRGNAFWRLLHAAGLTPEPLGYADDARLPALGLALTNLCPRPTRSAAELSRAERARGRRALLAKIERLRPGVVVLVGVTLCGDMFGRPGGGPGPKPEVLHGAPVFVLPNPSGLNASYPGFAHKRVWFVRLRRFLEEQEHGGHPRKRSQARRGSQRPHAARSR
jgi:TDG/mug DNA glycosylase family protein